MHRVEVSCLCTETMLHMEHLSESVRAFRDLLVKAVDPHTHLLLELRDNLLEVSLDSNDLALLAPPRVFKIFTEEDANVHEEHFETILEGLVRLGELLVETVGELLTTS